MGYHLHLLYHYHRVARISRNDGCPKLDSLSPPGGSRKDCETIKAGTTRCHPCGVDAQLLGPLNPNENLIGPVTAYGYSNSLFAHPLTSLSLSYNEH
jgi:hypothetical protein